jgi:mono/diheme cytochrome c family protein
MKNLQETCNRGIGLVTLCALFAVGNASALAEDRDQGYRLYVHYQCYQCHGYEGQGGSPGGPRLASLDYSF